MQLDALPPSQLQPGSKNKRSYVIKCCQSAIKSEENLRNYRVFRVSNREKRVISGFCHGANHFSFILMAEKGRDGVYEMRVLYTYSLNNSRFPSALRKKIDLKGKILQGLFSEKI